VTPPADTGDGGGESNDAGDTTQDSGLPGTQAQDGGDAGGGGGVDGSADSGEGGSVQPPAFITNPPGVVFTNTSTEDVGDLVLVTSNFTEQANSDGSFYLQWFGEVENVSNKLYCDIEIQINLASAGQTMAFQSFAEGAPYDATGLPAGTTTACVPPGTIAPMYTNNFGDTSANLPQATAVTYQLSGLISGSSTSTPAYVLDPATPTIAATYDSASGEVTGTLTGTGAISNIELHSFVRDATGLLQDRLEATDLGSLSTGETWTFMTTNTTATVVSHEEYVSFIDGT
jgi:hypothetical protein